LKLDLRYIEFQRNVGFLKIKEKPEKILKM